MTARTAALPVALVAGLIGLVAAVAQTPPAGKPPAPGPGEVDAVTKRAAVLEANLAKQSGTSPEGAAAMLDLIDLYHAEARPFGLVRVGQLFVTLHTSHPRHKEAMLKLLDGLTAVGRNKELIATSRQFVSRYPADPACAGVERRLAPLLRRSGDVPGSAAVNEARWKRLGPTDEGQRAGREAATTYLNLNALEPYAKAAALGEEMLDRLPAGGPATAAGWVAMDAYERRGEWAKANRVGLKLAQKSPPASPFYLQSLHARMGENYSRLAQRLNASESFRLAAAVPGVPARPDLESRRLSELHQTAPNPTAFEKLVQEYAQKYPFRPDIMPLTTLAALAHLTAKDPASAERLLERVLAHDARTHGAAGLYVGLFGAEADANVKKARLAKAEGVLRDAVAKSANPNNAGYLRYVLALELLRDRAKDVPRAKAVARELAHQFPIADGHTAAAINWLLDSAADEAEFKAEVGRVVEARRQKPWLAALRTTLPAWALARAKAKEKETAARVKYVRDELAAAAKDPTLAAWANYDQLAAEATPVQIAAARAKLLTPERVAAYPDDLAGELLYQQQYFLRYVAPAPRQPQSVEAAKQWVARLPKSPEAAAAYLSAAGDLLQVPEYRPAALATLKLEPTGNVDAYRRLMAAAATLKDAELGKQAWAWIRKGYARFPYDSTYASTIGDGLAGLGLKDEARDCWRRALTAGNPESAEFRECANRLLVGTAEEEKAKSLDELIAKDTPWRFGFAAAKADGLLKAGNVDAAVALLAASAAQLRDRAFGGQASLDAEYGTPANWVAQYRADAKATPADRRKVFAAVRDLGVRRASMVALAALAELPEETDALAPMARLLRLAEATQLAYGDSTDFDMLTAYVQAALARKDYMAAATLTAGMLANCPSTDEGRKKAGRDLLTQAYTRLGAAGGAVIDETSPIAPLLQAALQLRLGDPKLAFDTYLAHQKLFDDNRAAVPVDLLAFVCETHAAAGGDDNHNRVEDVLRAWLIANTDSKDADEADKARVQLLLARNYYRARRFDLARAEFTTLLNRYGKTAQAVEAEFGIGETFMEQKVYDQAEQAFEKLAGRRDRDVVIRAEFLRGVLASRRGDRDEARAIFRGVLERVPNVELANQALFNLSEVYGAEQRYMDQLELLRTVGRLGRASKRTHAPGEPLSIVVQDSDLGISRGHNRIPVRVTTEPGGDEETVYLLSGGAGKGLFRADLETQLGGAVKGDRVLQLTGRDLIRVDYPDDFKKEFKDAPLPDAEIRVASDGKLEIGSAKIVDEDEESFSQRLEREGRPADDGEESKAQVRPKDQVKPGNVVYLRVKDADRDVSDRPDAIQVRLAATSGDQVTATLTETGPHTGVFEGTAKTGELPAGAQATNSALDHGPLMAIDKDPLTYWLSEPDGATPKALTADMKDLKRVDRVALWTPDAKQHAPVRTSIEGSDDGRVWFRLAAFPAERPAPLLAWESGPMTARVFEGVRPNAVATWDQAVAWAKAAQPTSEARVGELVWNRTADEKRRTATVVVWHGKLVQPRSGAARIAVAADASAVLVDGRLESPLAPGKAVADVYLDAGTHDLTVFAVANPNTTALEARWVKGETTGPLTPVPFRESDFDLGRPEAKPVAPRALGEGVADKDGTSWEFRFPPVDVRHVRATFHEYRGEAVAINRMEIADSEKKVLHMPTDADLLSLATNDVLEISGGDAVVATYIDEANGTGSTRLLTAKLTATYHNGLIAPIAYDFEKVEGGGVNVRRKNLLRIDPGERIVVEVVDFDEDRTAGRDKVPVSVAVNDGPPLEMEAIESAEHSGAFTKEVDTTAGAEAGKLSVKPGDRVFLRYLDKQNTLPGHATVREAVVYVNRPTAGRVRIAESRAVRPKGMLADAPPRMVYLPPQPGTDAAKAVGVALEAPLTVEVIDPDAAKDSRSTVVVALTTTDGAKVDVECVLSDARPEKAAAGARVAGTALEEGRFTGQVILQLGGKDSPAVVPLNSSMPRDLVGGPKLPGEEGTPGARARSERSLSAHVLNLSGTDTVTAAYEDKLRPDGAGQKLVASARLLTDGKLSVTDAEYVKPVTAVHVGERLFLKVEDADHDRTGERDAVRVTVSTKRGERETIDLIETLAHSGVFTASVRLVPAEKPTPGNVRKDAPEIECFFGDALEVAYADDRAASAEGTLESTATVAVVIGTDGKVQSFSKAFADEALAVETQFHIAESHFELFKSHKALDRQAEARADLEAGRRVLREVMEDYPNPKYAPRVAYLFGQFAQELQQNAEAIQVYQAIVKQYPDHPLAPDAQFKLAQCYEEAKDFDPALEAYVTLAATYPKHPLIANVIVRICDHFYKAENYRVAAQVGERFVEKFEAHKWGPKMAFRVGQCHFKDKQYVKAGQAFDRFAKQFHDDPLGADAVFWSGESFRTGGNNREAFRRYNECRWKFPGSEAAKFARGRLALPEMIGQFEAEASSLEEKK